MNLSPENCPVCHQAAIAFDAGTTTPRRYFTQHSYQIAAGRARARLPVYRCPACGHGHTPLDVSSAEVAAWYQQQPGDTIFLSGEQARRRTARRVISRIKLIEPQGRLLDVGAGPGIFVDEAARAGFTACGLEPAAWAVTHARRAYHASMIQAGFEQLNQLPEHSFDAVTTFDVIEHVVDPAVFLPAIWRVLKPTGLLVLTTPRFDSFIARLLGRHWHAILPAHLHYFTRPSLHQLLQRSGFQMEAERMHTRHLSLTYILQRLVPAKSLSRLPLCTVPVNLADEFEIYARKQ